MSIKKAGEGCQWVSQVSQGDVCDEIACEKVSGAL